MDMVNELKVKISKLWVDNESKGYENFTIKIPSPLIYQYESMIFLVIKSENNKLRLMNKYGQILMTKPDKKICPISIKPILEIDSFVYDNILPSIKNNISI
jgi:hypothetical protein